MNTIVIPYKIVFIVLWSLYALYIVLSSNDSEGIYIFLIMGSLPISTQSELLIQKYHLSQTGLDGIALIIGMGYIQWIIVGIILDATWPKIKIRKKKR